MWVYRLKRSCDVFWMNTYYFNWVVFLSFSFTGFFLIAPWVWWNVETFLSYNREKSITQLRARQTSRLLESFFSFFFSSTLHQAEHGFFFYRTVFSYPHTYPRTTTTHTPFSSSIATFPVVISPEWPIFFMSILKNKKLTVTFLCL